MTDIYKRLAATVLAVPEDQVTPQQRTAAKQSFWATLQAAAQFPDNTALRELLESARGPDTLRFANFAWQPRWNDATAAASLSQDGADVMAVGFFGTLKFSLADKASCEAIVSRTRLFADMVESAAIHYLGG
jgi:hypothetical protein